MVEPSWGSFQTPETIQEEAPQKSIQSEPQQGSEQPKWGSFQNPSTYQQKPEESDEGWLSYLSRQAIRGSSRLGEQVLGAYGNVEKFGKEALTNLPKKLGPVGEAIYDLVGEKGWEKLIKGSQPDTQMFPTSEKLKETSQKISGGLTTPNTPGEKKADEFIEDVGSTINPAGRFSVTRNLTTPAAMNVAKELVEYMGLGEEAGNKAKLLVSLPLILSHSVNGPQHASNLMNEGRTGIPNTVQLNNVRFSNALDQVERGLLSSDPRTAVARQLIGGIRTDLANGQNTAQSLMTMYDGINAAKRSRGLFDLGRTDRRFATQSIDQVRHAVRDELMQSASAYPEALNSWNNGVRAWATIHTSNALTNWIQSTATGPYAKALTGPAAALFGVGAYVGSKSRMVSGSLTAAVPSIYKTGQVLYRTLNDPNLARYYFGAISGATRESLPMFLNNYNKLNKKLEESQSIKKNT